MSQPILHSYGEESSWLYSLREHGPSYQVSEHFRLIEFACRDGSDEVVLHDAVLQGLEWIRWYFGKPIIVSSGYRTDAYNRQVGGRPNSRHLYGLAADIIVIGIQPHRVAEYAERLEFGGVGRYPGKGFTHVDVYGYRRRWRR